MLFTDILFLFYFFPLFISLYLLAQKNNILANLIIVTFSLVFYASFGLSNLPILVIPLILDFVIAIGIHRFQGKTISKALLSIAVIGNLGLLAYFKYYDFILSNVGMENFSSNNIITLNSLKPLLIPLGISFITFQRISYIVDVYRKKIAPTTNFLKYATYATLFPHLISGPIVRFSQIKEQLGKRAINSETIFEGTKYFVLGFTFKLLVANQLFTVEDLIIQNINNIQFLESIILMFFFSFRIYFDFLGYSFIAIGLAKFIGFDFPQNFNSPYQSTSITDFWKRWNITLSSWLRDYLYIPLGGSRKGKIRTYINLLITMLLGGLWHGASWNFVIWGGLHGGFLAIERVLSDFKIKLTIPTYLSKILTFLIITFTWIIFRFSDTQQLDLFLKSLTKINISPPNEALVVPLIYSLPALIVAVFWSFFLNENFVLKIKPKTRNGWAFTVAFLFLITYSLLKKGVPFIYFQF
ncbi:MBOAT family protein [Candidatus Parcubacteria bacterium]|nr:MAG: MBOAT family protein [Candidatus Parcubacteria bacterium]